MTILEEYQHNLNTYLAQADNNRENKNYPLALQQYAKAIENFYKSLQLIETPGSGFYVDRYSYSQQKKISAIFYMAGIIQKVVFSYLEMEDHSEALFFNQKLYILVATIVKSEDDLNVQQIQSYQKLLENINMVDVIANHSLRDKAVEAQNQSNNNCDETFKNLSLNFDNFCSLNVYRFFSESSSSNRYSTSTDVSSLSSEGSTSSSSCFIATAAYSTSTHPDLDTFRSFRDEKLLPHPLGKNLVTLYYKTGPTIAKYIEKQPAIKQKLKHHLANLANWMRHKKITSR
ncbi:hypothetical protein NG798_14410 [Ancylothrix sp. C2]|uniref:CFI-box-CTERM domain-containing protein n=1 Tax=Ancylothrix sp. D3o TaxID=2953691 RepID=UPI0021BA5561|nr:CFI-box-CTERM domain-containing protein [Ancylothrix sp. D3o]MCT7950988.1 hypothetical protein [Ancylothrix sp. D3o]